MRLNRLRIVGFKTFVEPSEFLIEPGLTGVVGPNGCGKSNLVEALRWVMGENSYKSLRASGMDDVIFGGSNKRPARNNAEVMLSIDNSARTAPAQFNDNDLLEVSRKITRDDGSVYRINGREVRARDVQLLFADAATGARSHAMVRQGQIGEIIAAKPQARRRILEDAAGIAGLHSRRHEAELRLRAAEDNLQRLEDVMREIDGQVDGLRRQARQASRYRALSAEIRRYEAIGFFIAWQGAREQLAALEEASRNHEKSVTECLERQAQTAYARGIAAHTLAQSRNAEEASAGQLQQCMREQADLAAAERRARERAQDTARRISELERDLVREQAQLQDSRATAARLKDEDVILEERLSSSEYELAEAAETVTQASISLEATEVRLSQMQADAADVIARRAALARQALQEEERLTKLTSERDLIISDLDALNAHVRSSEETALLREELESLETASIAAEERVLEARKTLVAFREAEEALRKPLTEAENRLQRLIAEIAILTKLVTSVAGDGFTAVLDSIHVHKGYERALGAVLGDDLLASLDPDASIHWTDTGVHPDDALLPAGVVALSTVVEAPSALIRRLRMIGIVNREAGARLREFLSPGQRLVSPEGDVWRWDGLTNTADAPTTASRRLEERNRLSDLELEAEVAQAALDLQQQALNGSQERTHAATYEEAQSMEAQRIARRAFEAARVRLLEAERAAASIAARRAALDEAYARLSEAQIQAQESVGSLRGELQDLPEPDHQQLEQTRAQVGHARAAHRESEQILQTLQRDISARIRRREAIAAELKAWEERVARAASVLNDIEERLINAREMQVELTESAEEMAMRHEGMAAVVLEAQEQVAQAGKARHEAEAALAVVDEKVSQALDALSQAREARARSTALVESAHEKLNDIVRQIADALGVPPEKLPEHTGLEADVSIPDQREVEDRLMVLRHDRDRLGAVNLRAEAELAETQEKRDGISAEHAELVEAIRRLRQAISNLNREGRERLLAAFSVVNGHFQRLFTSLFGGGTADLTLVDSDDPLEAGLEIYARPPGKKPQVLTLLSGGEQALTAIALIFAVFLTNPSPVCVLDEVDAPLDDANVERYCSLLRNMAMQTETRFIVITHNPITMAAMDRLFGVTMAEKGISQLVSVDLEHAERILDAG